jgi:hypothetical protein
MSSSLPTHTLLLVCTADPCTLLYNLRLMAPHSSPAHSAGVSTQRLRSNPIRQKKFASNLNSLQLHTFPASKVSPQPLPPSPQSDIDLAGIHKMDEGRLQSSKHRPRPISDEDSDTSHTHNSRAGSSGKRLSSNADLPPPDVPTFSPAQLPS